MLLTCRYHASTGLPIDKLGRVRKLRDSSQSHTPVLFDTRATLFGLVRSGTTRGNLALPLSETKGVRLILTVDDDNHGIGIGIERRSHEVDVSDLFVCGVTRRDLVDDPPCHVGLTDNF
jgi:hypothetical protein